LIHGGCSRGTTHLKDNAGRRRQDAKPEDKIEPNHEGERQVDENYHQEYARDCAPAEPVAWQAFRLVSAAEPQRDSGGRQYDAAYEQHRPGDKGQWEAEEALHKMHGRLSDASGLAYGGMLSGASGITVKQLVHIFCRLMQRHNSHTGG